MRCARLLRTARWRPRTPVITSAQLCGIRVATCKHRYFTLSTLTALLTPPAVFGGLFITLWTYKCIMMVIFQNKIIYMPGIPPFARSEKVSDYVNQCRPVEWHEHVVKASDGTVLKLLEGHIPEKVATKKVVVLYLQGNAASTPPRLPYLSSILKQIETKDQALTTSATLIALSYRGFWTSRGRPSQPGIELDAAAALNWIFERYSTNDTHIVIWGQSIGAGVATTALSNFVESSPDAARLKAITGILLETPFVDMSSMLVALYPQRFLPYRYLTPFLKSSWNSRAALTAVAQSGRVHPRILILQAGDDEIVPADHAGILHKICEEGGLDVDHKVVTGALHTEIMAKGQGRVLIANFLASM